jgi:acyl-CoA carboxylase epsilon subunit
VSATGDRPVFRVISGDASPEEIAAVVAAVAAAGPSGAEAPADDGTTSIWAARGYGHRHIRATFTPSPHGWRTSFWPR